MQMPLINTHQGVEITIHISETTHVPGEMSLELCNRMLIPKGGVVADVGCGSGYLGIVSALLGAGTVYCIDPAEDAIEATRINCQLNAVANIEVMRGKELVPVLGERFDVILTNPPQTPFPTELDSRRYGGCRGTDVIERIIEQASAVLKPSGRLYVSHVSHSYPQRVYDCIGLCGLTHRLIAERRKPLFKDEILTAHPGLLDYILELGKKGIAELEEEDGVIYYYHRLYEVMRATQTVA